MSNRVRTSGTRVTSPHYGARRRSRLPIALFYVLFVLYCLGGMYMGYVFVYGVGQLLESFGLGSPVANVPAPPGPFASIDSVAPWTGKDRLNILLLGLDQRDDEVGQPSRSDTIIVLTMDPVSKTAAMLSIPRDLMVPIPGIGENKINTAHFFGEVQREGYGPTLARRTIEQNFGIPIHYYARVNFRGFERLIDAIGGIDIDVPRPILDDEYPLEGGGVKRVYVPAGWQHMDGRTALEYARSRHADSDFGRNQRQQQVLVSAANRAFQLDMVPKLPGMLGILRESVTTDIPPTTILSIAQLARSIGGRNISSAAIDGTMFTVHSDAQTYYLVPKWPEIKKLVARVFAGSPSPDSSDEQLESARIEVLNGTGRVGLAAATGSFLKDKGFVLVRIDNADKDDYSQTAIINHTGKVAAARRIAGLLKVPESRIVTSPQGSDDVDITLVLGEDLSLPGQSSP